MGFGKCKNSISGLALNFKIIFVINLEDSIEYLKLKFILASKDQRRKNKAKLSDALIPVDCSADDEFALRFFND